MLVRLDFVGHPFGLLQTGCRLAVVACSHVYAGQSDKRVQGVPFVVRRLHQPVSLLVFRFGLVILVCLLVHGTKIGVAERYAERAVGALVQLHRLAEIHPCRVVHPPMTEDRTEVGIVDGLSQRAVELPFALECQP